ncbi:MAG: DUF4375 domain-containing protein [Pseudomonadota bacterium]
MSHISTPENEALVSAAYAAALQDRSEGRELSPSLQLLYEVEMLCQEVNSGASFEQYFRWASLEEIRQAPARLEELGLPALARLVRTAATVAFPAGLPASEAEVDELTDWSPEQDAELALLADELTDANGLLTDTLADWYRRARGD